MNKPAMHRAKEHQSAQSLLDFIDASPSPWHAVENMVEQLKSAGYRELRETEQWQPQVGQGYYVVRDDASLVCFRLGERPLHEAGLRIIGAHTDSPGLRIKPKAQVDKQQTSMLGVEVYGGPILATFTDRDLSIAGRLSLRRNNAQAQIQLVRFNDALVRLPNLAIHMNRTVNKEGLKLNSQTELGLLLAVAEPSTSPDTQLFLKLLANQAQCEIEQILAWDLAVYDSQAGSFWGQDNAFIANSQLDNLASCHAGLSALLSASNDNKQATLCCAFFDHEEVGSESVSGAAGSFLSDVIQRINSCVANNAQQYHQTLANSFMLSADMAHAWQPSFASAYEPDHHVLVNHGPVIKVNANQRYASNAYSEARFIEYCQQAEVPWQRYVHRNDIPCGSTIGPMSAAKLGIQTVDVGNPMWAMHSLRESAGSLDHDYLIKAFNCFFTAND